MLNKIEEKIIFPALRIISIGAIGLLLLTMVFIIIPESAPEKSSYQSIQKSLEVTTIDNEKRNWKSKNETLFLNDDAFKQVEEIINDVPLEYQQEYVNVVENVIKTTIEKEDNISVEQLNALLNAEKDRISKKIEIKNQSGFEKAIKYLTLICVLMCLVLFGNLLCLLKIKKNTSK